MFIFASGFTVYQMYINWTTIRKIAFQILRKYLIWAIPLYLLVSLKQGSIDIQYIINGLIKGGPMPAYWFLVLIVVIYLMTPFWIKLIKIYPKLAIGLAILLQCLQWMRFYFNPQWVLPNVIENLIIRPLLFSPPFVAGMFLASHVKEFVAVLEKKRSLLVYLTTISALLCIIETVLWGYKSGWSNKALNMGFLTERFTLTLFFVCSTLLIVSAESKKSRMRKWLSDVGLATLGILFMMDICLSVFTFLLWHIPDWIWNSDITGYSQNTAPQWLICFSPWVTIFYFIAGLWGPLYVMKWAEKIFGNRIRILW